MWSNQNTGQQSSKFPHPHFYLMFSKMKRKLHDYHSSHVLHNVRSRHTQDAPINLQRGLAGQTQHTKQTDRTDFRSMRAWMWFYQKASFQNGLLKVFSAKPGHGGALPLLTSFLSNTTPCWKMLVQIKWLWEYPAPQLTIGQYEIQGKKNLLILI